MLPYWYDAIVPDLAAGRTVLVVAHGNSLRALVKHLDGISDAAIAELNIPTGIPLLYELDDGVRARWCPAAGTWTRRRRSRRRGRQEPGPLTAGQMVNGPCLDECPDEVCRQGEHPEKSEISRNLPIVGDPGRSAYHQIREYGLVTPVRAAAATRIIRWSWNDGMAIRTRTGGGVRQPRSARLQGGAAAGEAAAGHRLGPVRALLVRGRRGQRRPGAARQRRGPRVRHRQGRPADGERAAALARQVRRDGEIREAEFEVPVPRFGGRTTTLRGPGGPAVGDRRRRRARPACSPRTRPRATGSKRSAGTSSPTSATSSRPR